ncbi:hypothetical protein BVER_03863 [Candidatus Burkholderia verschuerenii]|uniref:Uncharacterized protein n=1 Tax=Candidatus Burkholderia verschuerenii TaxID=242163 RepID=A0A0L0MEK6_9BURK|nr:hypothetical protein [Candidatus Burkholderia verschuerenii]KND60409.1 hypothetical protein BVER_03863 [Candidatus Burkholderia verschuerenii]
METSFQGRMCGVCHGALRSRYFSLSKATEKVERSGGETIATVLSSTLMTDFCDESCRDEALAAIVSTLKVACQLFAVTAACSLCQREVDRRAPHVSIGILEFEDASQPWLMSARVLDDRELAVYCADCATPETAARAEAVDATAQ